MIGIKKMSELLWLERFRAKADLEFEVEEWGREQPDFLIRFCGRQVGVEITELQLDQTEVGLLEGSELKKLHSVRSEIVKRAQTQYFEGGCRSINATFLFELGSSAVSNANRIELAKSIAKVLGKLQLGDMEKYNAGSTGIPTRRFLPR